MAKNIILENTGDAAIYLPVKPEENEVLIIPRATKTKVEEKGTGESHFVKTPGRAEIDSDVLEALKKKSKVVTTYFSTGMLRVVGSGPPPAQGAGNKEGK